MTSRLARGRGKSSAMGGSPRIGGGAGTLAGSSTRPLAQRVPSSSVSSASYALSLASASATRKRLRS